MARGRTKIDRSRFRGKVFRSKPQLGIALLQGEESDISLWAVRFPDGKYKIFLNRGEAEAAYESGVAVLDAPRATPMRRNPSPRRVRRLKRNPRGGMYLEYDWTSNVYRPRFGDTFTSVDGYRSFADLQEAKYVLKGRGLKLGKKTDTRTWRIENMDAKTLRSNPVRRRLQRNPMRGPMRFKDVQAKLRDKGMTIRATGHGQEWRVNYTGTVGTEGTAYYTNDLRDAYDTGLTMAAQKFSRNPKRRRSRVRAFKVTHKRGKVRVRKLRRNPPAAYVIKAKHVTGAPYYFNGRGFEKSKADATRFASLSNAKREAQRIVNRLPFSILSIGVHKA